MKLLVVFLSLASVTMAIDNWSVIYAASDVLYGTNVDANLKTILEDVINHLMQVSFNAPESQQAYLGVYPTLESFPDNFVPTLNAALEDPKTGPVLTQVYTEMLDRFMTLIFAVEEPTAVAVQPIVAPLLPIAGPVQPITLPVVPSPIGLPVAPIAEPVVEQPIAAAQSPLVQLILNIRQN